MCANLIGFQSWFPGAELPFWVGSRLKVVYTVETPAMEDQVPSYHSEFLRSPHHAGLALATLGLGFLSANPLGLLVGVTAYALGWIYMPDLPFFRGSVNRRRDLARRAAEMQKINEFIRRRDSLLSSLSASLRERYGRLAAVCHDIETASADSPRTGRTKAATRSPSKAISVLRSLPGWNSGATC